ncbi:LRR receptor-like serine/threonine-protein kinase [Nymphaea thermarum]|nr:LRR receptor-like serine/threonine-protein kinase [Nymphaea thermarum]
MPSPRWLAAAINTKDDSCLCGRSLHSLGELDLSSNGFSGTIPPEIGNCSNLIKLSLSNNRFSGEIPSTIGNLASLNVLNLHSIPTTVRNGKKHNELRISQNFLSGSIPKEVGELTELQEALDLSENSLSGVIPPSLGNLKKLESLILSRNHLEGQIPKALGGLTSLNNLNLSDNLLHVEIPQGLSKLPSASFLGNMNLCGPLLSSCSDSVGGGRTWMSRAAVLGITVDIALAATCVCLALLYAILRVWCNYRKISVSSSDFNVGLEDRKEDEKWILGKTHHLGLVGSPEEEKRKGKLNF